MKLFPLACALVLLGWTALCAPGCDASIEPDEAMTSVELALPAGPYNPTPGDPDPCIPDCADKECGGDGCGGSCGACPPGISCKYDGTCCFPDCEGKVCGPTGCGGVCGTCPRGHGCAGGYQCLPLAP